MHYGNIITSDVANGLGCRTSLFVSGCRHHCKNCFNPQTWDFNYGENYTDETEQFIIDSLSKQYIDGLTILGGEPFEPENQPTLLQLMQKIKTSIPDKTIWIYSGYLWEEMTGEKPSHIRTDYTNDILKNIDVLVDGEFKQDLYEITLQYRGSYNQRILNVQESLKQKQPTLFNEKWGVKYE